MSRLKTLFHCFCMIILFGQLNACSKTDEQESAQTSPATEMTDSVKSDSSNSDIQTNQNTPATGSSSSAPPSESTDAAGNKMADSSTSSAKEQTSTDTSQQNTDSHQAALALARKSGCLACHAVDKKVVGPPWRDVSKRYKDDPEAKNKLVAKVSSGGRGNWTDVVGPAAMPAYSPRVSDADIGKLVEFVLSLENSQ